MTQAFPIEVAAGLIFRHGRLLIAQRRAQDHLGNLWEFPGGKREGTESYEDCLQRELREELGILVQPGDLVESITHCYPEKTVHLKFFKCLLLAHEPRPLACQAVAWIEREELDKHAFPAADERILKRLQSSPDLWK
jgi:mutator protein MutT